MKQENELPNTNILERIHQDAQRLDNRLRGLQIDTINDPDEDMKKELARLLYPLGVDVLSALAHMGLDFEFMLTGVPDNITTVEEFQARQRREK